MYAGMYRARQGDRPKPPTPSQAEPGIHFPEGEMREAEKGIRLWSSLPARRDGTWIPALPLQ